MKRSNKMISLIITISMLFTFTTPSIAINIEDQDILCCNGYVTLEKGKSIDADVKEIETSKLVTAELYSVSEKEKNEIDEIVNNGTDVFIRCNISNEISKEFIKEKKIETVNNSGCFVGWYIHNEGAGIEVTPVNVICMYEDKSFVSKKEFMDDCLNIAVNYKVNPEELYKSFGDADMLNVIFQNAKDNEKAKLQEIDIDSQLRSYYSESVYYNAFGKSKEISWSDASSLSGYYALGNAQISLLLISAGRKSGKNYDTMITCTTVSAKDGSNYKVKKYATLLGVSGDNYHSFTYPTCTDDKKVSVTYGISVNNSGVTSEYKATTTVNPDGQSFSPTVVDSESSKCYATPASAKKGAAWEMVMSGWTETNVDSQAIIVAGVSNLEISNLVTYTLSNEELYIMVLIKNHNVLSDSING